jgi:hypothetical protein
VYLTAGPVCSVFTRSERTEQWFNDVLVSTVPQSCEGSVDSGHEWWRGSLHQSVLGILAKVLDDPKSPENKSTITEVLFYGVVDQPSEQTSPPTPPPSSPQVGTSTVYSIPKAAEQVNVRVQAIPLSSDFFTHIPSPPLSPTQPAVTDDAQFLPSIAELRYAAEEERKKRKRVTDVFDQATETRKQARRKGGQGVAAAASRIDEVNTLIGQKKVKAAVKVEVTGNAKVIEKNVDLQNLQSKFDQAKPDNSIEGSASRRLLSRSPSMSSDIRPLSRKGFIDGTKRSSLSQTTNVFETATVEARNKETISRFVMAGMRLYGLQQRKKLGHSRRVSQITPVAAAANTSTEDSANDEEYKSIYHQTFRGVVFAFVSYFSTRTKSASNG